MGLIFYFYKLYCVFILYLATMSMFIRLLKNLQRKPMVQMAYHRFIITLLFNRHRGTVAQRDFCTPFVYYVVVVFAV